MPLVAGGDFVLGGDAGVAAGAGAAGVVAAALGGCAGLRVKKLDIVGWVLF